MPGLMGGFGAFVPSWRTFLRTVVSVGTDATALQPATPLVGRIGIWLYNAGTASVFVAGADVATTNENPLRPGAEKIIQVSELVTMYGRVSSGTVNVVVWEFGV